MCKIPELKGNWTLIAGATSVMGYEMARSLAARGQNMVLVCHDEERLCQIARELNEDSDIIIMPVDLKKPGAYKLLHRECKRLELKISAYFNFSR